MEIIQKKWWYEELCHMLEIFHDEVTTLKGHPQTYRDGNFI
jgi:hypothetical protein